MLACLLFCVQTVFVRHQPSDPI